MISSAMAQGGVLDLTSLNEYANQDRPDNIHKDNVPEVAGALFPLFL